MIELTQWKHRSQNTTEKLTRPEDGKLTIKLSENPTTGYCWEVEGDDVSIVGDDFAGPPEYSDGGELLVGGGGYRVLTLDVPSTAREVSLRHGQSWMRGKENDEASYLTIQFV